MQLIYSLEYLESTDSTDLRHSLLADRVRDSMMVMDETESDDRRDSYFGFNGGFDHGMPSGKTCNVCNAYHHHLSLSLL